jgi:two-component system, sensor histidine kinase and response regulator
MLNGDLVIVDDVSENLSVLSSLLIKEGYRVRSAISGALALQTIELQIPDLILLDIRMPNMNGFEVCERLKANEKTRNIPVIFLSALNEVEDKVKAFSMGGVDYITKPFQADEVHARIQTHLMLAQQRSDIENLHLIQSQMIDLVTHNLKTPLSTILLYADMIKRASPEKVVNYANKINQTVEQMDSLVSDFFDLNRLDSTTTFAIQEINMAEFIKNVVEQYVFLAQKEAWFKLD